MAFNDMADILVRQSWQVAVVFGLVWTAVTILWRASSHWRYLLWLLVVAKCLTPPLVDVSIPLLTMNPPVASRPVEVSSVARGEAPVEAMLVALPPGSGASEIQNQAPASVQTMKHGVSTSFTVKQWLVVLWMLTVSTILGSVIVRFWTTNQQLKRLRLPADEETRLAVVSLARTLGLSSPPNVYVSSAVSQPFVWGLIRGDIYVPSQFALNGSMEQRRSVLAHELAHVARYDAIVNLAQIVVQSLFFFHPLVWWANRRIRHEREKCCDEVVLAGTQTEPHVYCSAIVETLASGSRQSRWTATLAVTGSIKSIEDRVVTMLAPDRKFQRRPSRVAVVTTLFVAVCLLPTAIVLTSRSQLGAAADQPAQEQGDGVNKDASQGTIATDSKSSTWQTGHKMELRVIDSRTGKSLSGVKLELQNTGPGIDSQDVKVQATDDSGVSIIPFPDRPANEVRIYPSKPGYVPLRVYWDGEPHVVIPKTITIPMDPGKVFGGILRNNEGKPIPDVKVTVHYWAKGKGKNPHVRANIGEATTSDGDGRWRLDIMPAEVIAQDMRIYVSHPDYVSDYLPPGYLPIPVIDQPAIKDLYAGTAVMIMADGDTIEGKLVSSEANQPVSGAKVFLSDVPWFNEPRATSDKDGQFKISGVSRVTPNGRTRNTNYPLAVVVQAPGYAPELVDIGVGSDVLQIELNPARKVRGQVVDEQGKPIEGARIAADQWRGRRGHLPLQATSGTDGSFSITDAPADKVEYTVYKEGYLASEHLEMTPTDDEYEVTLKPLIQIVGSVIDAKTGKPIEKFSVMQGIDYDDGRAPFWMFFDKKTYSATKYIANIQQRGFKYRVRVEAEGYMPDESRLIKPYDPDAGQITIDFKLQKAPNLTGIVQAADRKPLANAQVYLVRGYLNISNRQVTHVEQGDPTAKTDDAGRFEFPPEVEAYCVIVVHEQGIAMITEKQFKASSKITIQPWDSQKADLQIVPRPAQGMLVDFPLK